MNSQGIQVERAYGRAVLGGFHATFSLGGIAGAAAGGLAAANGVGVGAHFAVAALVLGLGYLAASRALPPDPPTRGERGPVLALPTRGLWIPGVIAFCALMGEGVMNDWGAVYLDDVAGAGAGTAAFGFAVFSAGMVIGRLLADRLRDRFGATAFVMGCGLVAGCGTVLAVAVPVPGAGLVAYALIGLGMAAVIPVVFAHAVAVRPAAPGPTIAAVSAVGYVGFLAGPPTIGGIAEVTSLRGAMLALLALTAVLTLLARGLATARPGR